MEVYCHPASLVKQLASYERWALIIELFLGVNAAVVCAMLAYMMCQGSAGSLGSLCSLVGLFPFKRAPFILICYTFLFEKIIFSLYSSKILLRGSLGFYLDLFCFVQKEVERFVHIDSNFERPFLDFIKFSEEF